MTTHTEGDIDGKVKVGDVSHCTVKLQAENINLEIFSRKNLPYEHPKDCDEDGNRPHFLCTEEIQVAWRGPGSRHLTSILVMNFVLTCLPALLSASQQGKGRSHKLPREPSTNLSYASFRLIRTSLPFIFAILFIIFTVFSPSPMDNSHLKSYFSILAKKLPTKTCKTLALREEWQ